MNPLQRLVNAFCQLPGIGEKSATRLALFVLRDERGVGQELATALKFVKEKMRFCQECQNLTEAEFCSICLDTNRAANTICVVEDLADLLALEKTGDYKGRYHVLHGSIAPLDGIGPEEIRIRSLLERIKGGAIQEVILATNSNSTGEMTALYLKKQLGSYDVRVSRIASGIPVGGNVEHTDAQTLSRALESRREF